MITTQLSDAVISANTGLDAIQRAPIVEEDTGIKCLRIQDISQSKQYSDWGFCDVTDNDFSRFQLQHGDILIARTGGSIGVNTFIREKVQSVFNNGLIRLRINTEKFLPKFIYYTLRIPAYREHIDSIAFGTSTQPNMQIKDLLRYEFPTCNLRQQETIVSIMSALDDKIELNRRMNATLEAMARALFQSWFVDFDPVRAKLDPDRSGPSLDSATAALFPEHLEDSSLGHIPNGWKCGTIGELAVRILDKVDDPADWASEPLIDLSRMPQRSVALGEWGLGAELTTSVTRFRPKDVLFGAIRPYFHKVGIAPVSGVTNVSVFVIRARKSFDWPFLAALCSLDSTVELATRVSKGTKMPVVGWPDFSNFSVVVPPEELRQKFAEAVAPLYEGIFANLHQSRTLATLRDTLLPKLLSGELSVASFEKEVLP